MLKNYLKINLRNINRNKAYSFINIAGLVIGLTCFILIMMFVKYELSYDEFHVNAERTYRIVCQLPGEKYGMSEGILAVTPAPLASAIMESIPEVEFSTKINHYNRLLLSRKDDHYYEEGIFADKNFLDIFSFQLVTGDINQVLENPQNIIISQQMAKKFFGDDDPMGKTLTCYLGDFTVAGLVRDVPENSHIQFDWIIPFESQFRPKDRDRRMNMWNWDNYYSYLRLQPGIDINTFEKKLNALTKKNYADWEARTHFRYFLQPLEQVHLTSGFRYELGVATDISLIRLISAVALFVLLIACINVVNLSSANISKRAKEVGIRKVVGSSRQQLFWQFTGESLFLSFLSLGTAIFLVDLILPGFNQLVGRNIEWNAIIGTTTIFGLLAIVVITGLISGIYPSIILSSMASVKILSGNKIEQTKGINLRNILVLFQFSIAIVLMIASLIIFRQIEFIRDKEVGYTRDQILVLNRADPGIRENMDVIKNELLKNPKIIDITTSSQLPTNILTATGTGFQKDDGEEKMLHYQFIGIDYNFIDMLELEIVQGRNFSENSEIDLNTSLIVNETFAKQMGWSNPVGKIMPQVWNGPNDANYSVIGVVKDFHARPLHLEIKPVIMAYIPNSFWIHIRMQPGNFEGALSDIEKIYNRFNVRYPFEYFFLDDQFNEMYQSEEKLGQIILYSNILAIFIACLGIFGLAAFTAERRTKEIGIRKVLGASVSAIVSSLSWNFTKWVIVANIIAWPIAFYIMNKWLQTFTYRINLEWWLFVVAGFVTLLIALMTVFYHSIKTAVANPIRSLRYE